MWNDMLSDFIGIPRCDIAGAVAQIRGYIPRLKVEPELPERLRAQRVYALRQAHHSVTELFKSRRGDVRILWAWPIITSALRSGDDPARALLAEGHILFTAVTESDDVVGSTWLRSPRYEGRGVLLKMTNLSTEDVSIHCARERLAPRDAGIPKDVEIRGNLEAVFEGVDLTSGTWSTGDVHLRYATLCDVTEWSAIAGPVTISNALRRGTLSRGERMSDAAYARFRELFRRELRAVALRVRKQALRKRVAAIEPPLTRETFALLLDAVGVASEDRRDLLAAWEVMDGDHGGFTVQLKPVLVEKASTTFSRDQPSPEWESPPMEILDRKRAAVLDLTWGLHRTVEGEESEEESVDDDTTVDVSPLERLFSELRDASQWLAGSRELFRALIELSL